MSKINLGDKVKCIYTGFTGVAVAKTEFINGCINFLVAPKWDGKTHLVEEMGIDEDSLKVIKPVKKKVDEDDEDDEGETGGPMRKLNSRGGY